MMREQDKPVVVAMLKTTNQRKSGSNMASITTPSRQRRQSALAPASAPASISKRRRRSLEWVAANEPVLSLRKQGQPIKESIQFSIRSLEVDTVTPAKQRCNRTSLGSSSATKATLSAIKRRRQRDQSMNSDVETSVRKKRRVNLVSVPSTSSMDLLRLRRKTSTESVDTSATPSKRGSRRASVVYKPASVRMRRKRRSSLGKENLESSTKRGRWDGEMTDQTHKAHTWTREIERITETTKAKMMKVGSSYVPHMTIAQLELASKVWKKLGEIEEDEETEMWTVLTRLAIDLEVSHLKLVRFLKGDADKMISQSKVRLLDEILTTWLVNQPPTSNFGRINEKEGRKALSEWAGTSQSLYEL
jgi:hypothetical protein